MNTRNILSLLVAVVVLTLLFSSVFVLDETKQAIVTQFGKPVGEPRTQPGLHFKIPMVQKVQFFDKRYLEWDGDANQVPTKDKKFIFVDPTPAGK